MRYMYRDASNYRGYGRAVFSPPYRLVDKRRFLSLLDSDGCFNIEDAPRLPHPAEALAGGSAEDHPLMEVCEDWIAEAGSLQDRPWNVDWEVRCVLDISFAEFVTDLAAAQARRAETAGAR